MRGFYLVGVFVCFVQLVSAQTQNFWTKKNDFSGGKRERAVAFSIGDYGYIGTGVDTAENVKKDFWRYDAVIDSWTQIANLPGAARRDAVGFAVNGKGYCGTGIDNDASFMGTKLKDFWEYNPATNTWVQKSDYPGGGGNGIYFSTAFTIDSKGYLCGGKIGPNFYSSQLWEYKPANDQWSPRANFPGGVRYQLSSFSIGYYGYVGLGANQDVFKKDFWKYNPVTNQWSAIANLPGPERGGSATFTIGNKGYVCMGTDGGYLDDLWEYNPANNTWYIRAFYGGSERKNSVAFTLGDKAYVGTGKGYSGKKSSIQEYTPYQYLGLGDQISLEMNIYPNPAQETLSLIIPENLSGKVIIRDVLGKIHWDGDYTENMELSINVQSLKAGNYFVSFMDSENGVSGSSKFIKL
jgi:N-acetylneuraminic acid mutarotase